MRRAVALIAVLAITGAPALIGCEGRSGLGDRLDRTSQAGQADTGSGTESGGQTGTQAGTGSVDADLDAVQAMLREIDSTLAEDRQPPEDAD
jgi:hypothetical protein